MRIAPLLFAAVVAACVPAQEPKPAPVAPKPQDPAAALAEMMQQFTKEGITLDVKAGTLKLAAVMNAPQDALEYLLIHRRGKRHEAMLWTKAKPSVLNGALLLLGLTPGQNAKAEEIVPPPSIEEIEKGAETVKVTPPKGMNLWFTVQWTTPEGKVVEYCLEDLLLDLTTQRAVVGCSWVYLGGRMGQLYRNEPEVFVADFEGNLVSACYMTPDNHLVTIVHERGRDQHNWWLTSKAPEPDTEVQITIHRQQPKLHQEREARLAKETAENKGEPQPEGGKPVAPPSERTGGGK